MPWKLTVLNKEVAKELNQMYGQTRTAPMSVGLFLKVPIRIQLIQQEEIDYSQLYKSYTAYTKVGNEVEVFFDFFYSDEKSLNSLINLIEINSTFWAYLYQHELLHILFKHITKAFDSRMARIAKECKPNLAPALIHSYINIAEDYFINYSIKDIVKSTSSNGMSTFLEYGVYNQDYHNQKLSDIDILRRILDDITVTSTPLANGYSLQIAEDSKGNKQASITKDGTGSGSDGKNAKLSDTELADLASSVNSTIQSHAKGSSAASITAQLFKSIKVNTD